jgi:hypothetical protein
MNLGFHPFRPHNGKNIGFMQFVTALRQVYRLSIPFAVALASGAVFVSLRSRGSFYVNLDDLATHNLIEHDASLAHADAAPGQRKAPVDVDLDLLRSLISKAAPHHGLTLANFAQARVQREATLKKPLDSMHLRIARGESGLAWLVLKGDASGEVNVERLRKWMGEERLDLDWWLREGRKTVGLLQAMRLGTEVARLMADIRSRND